MSTGLYENADLLIVRGEVVKTRFSDEQRASVYHAAPDLLQTLKEAVAALDESDQDTYDGGALTSRIRAAIAKATEDTR